jgi:DNA-binding FadR family transcriptional regulator
MAAARASKRDVERLTAALGRMEEIAERPESIASEERFHGAHIAFHQALIAAAGNRALAGLAERIHAAWLLARPLARPPHRQERALTELRRILAAVTDGDAALARKAMNDHFDTIAGNLDEHRGRRRSQRRRAAS